MKYLVAWSFGTHHCTVETTKEDFDKVIDSITTEFEIFKEDYVDEENEDFNHVKYYIHNYYGDREIIGYTYNQEEGRCKNGKI